MRVERWGESAEGGQDRFRGEVAGDMPPDELRVALDQASAWVLEYLSGIEKLPVLPRVRPGDLRRALPANPPEQGEPFERIFHDFRKLVLPAVTHWNHPGFLGYFAITGSGPGILGELVAAALNVNAMVWRTSPAGTELEEVTLEWLRDLLGLPRVFSGTINDTASSSTLYALAAAREAALPQAWEHGLRFAPPGRFYASEQAHSSVDKAVLTLGLGRRGLRKIPTDEAFRMLPEALERAVAEDRDAGIRPIGVVATLGTTSTTSLDPVEEIAAIARKNGLWLHVDAAYAGSAAMLPELRSLFAGWEAADSIVVNPHKWLFTPLDCSVLFTRDPEALPRAFRLTPEYLNTPEAGEARNLMDYGVALGRRFRALKLWFVLRYFGAQGIRARIRNHLFLAQEFARWVDAEADWERMAPVPFSTVVFRYAPPSTDPPAQDELNRGILEAVNARGTAFLSHTVLRGRYCLRVAVGNLRTTLSHLEGAWRILKEEALRARSGS